MSIEEKSEPLQTQLLATCNIIPGLNIVHCSLKELPLHCPSCASDTAAQKGVLSSSQRRKLSKAPGLPPADILAQLTVEQIVMSRKPTIIDRLINQNKTALIMESRKRRGRPSKEDIAVNGKRKANTAADHLEKKRLRSAKADIKTDVKKKILPSSGKKRKLENDPAPGTNRYATRISMNKVRIPFSLRSGRKMADILKAKRKRGRKQHLQMNITEKKINQVDSDTFPATDQHGSKIKSEDLKPKKKRRRRCSMWVKKYKKPTKKAEDLPVLNKVESDEDEKSEVEEEVEPLMPTLEKEIDHTDIILKDEEIKHESPDVSLQNRNLELNDIVETKNFVCTTKATADNQEVFTESDIEIKNEINSSLIPDSKVVDDNVELSKTCENISEVPSNEQNTTTGEIIGTKSQLQTNTELELNVRSKDLNSELCKTLSIRSSSAEKIEKNILNHPTNGTLEAENENIETEYHTASKKSFPDEGQKLTSNNDSGTGNTEEQLVLTKGLKKNVDPVNNETEFNLLDKQNSNKLNCTSIPDIVKVKEESYQVQVNGIIKPEESIKQNLNEPDALVQIEVGNNAKELNNELRRVPNEGENKICCSEDDDNEEEEEEEIHPREADSTSDFSNAITESSASEQFLTISNVELAKSFTEVPVLPDSTKEVKSCSPEIKLEKEQTLDRDVLDLEKSSQNKDLSTINESELKSSRVNVKDVSENGSTVKGGNDVDRRISVERKQIKESMLQALGLKSLSSASDNKLQNEEDKQKYNNQQQQQQRNNSGYTGTLKAVIKLNRSGDKKRSMVYKRSEDALSACDKLEYRICSDFPSTESVPITHLADMGYNKKGFHHKNSESVTNSVYVNTNAGNSNNEEADVNGDESKGSKESCLIIPEKSSSFSIHPGRLCSDVCSYCFGKFGSLDTPCHVAQIKGEERQKKILQNEPHLTPESCLCDACYRYVDRKVNYHPKTGNQPGANTNNNSNSNSNNAPKSHPQPQPQASCCVVNCLQQATHTIKRKGILKLKKNLTHKLEIDMDKHTGLYFPFCSQHHYWVEYLTVCGICRKRLNRNSLFSLGSEADKLNLMLAEDGIPARLSDNLFLCKLCRYYSNLRLKYSDASAIPAQNKSFYKSYRRKILMSLDIAVSNSEDECDNSEDSSTPEKKHVASASSIAKKTSHSSNSTNGSSGGMYTADNPPGGSSSNNESATEETVSLSDLASLLGDQPDPQQARIQVKFGNVNIGRLSNLNIGQQGTSSAPSPVSTDRESSEGTLSCNLDFKGPSPDGTLERCVTTIQFDKKAKQLWTELQKPHGSQSLFLRHLIMMEKIWRTGQLVLSANADEKAIKYVLNAKNKIRACENSTINSGGSNIGTGNPVRPTKPKEASAPHPVRIQQQLQQPPLKVQPKQPQLQPQLGQASHPKPQVTKQSVQQQAIPPKQERFPLLPNNGEIEVTPVRTTAQTQVVTVVPSPVITVTSSLQQQQYMRPTNLQNFKPNVPQNSSNNQTVLQQQLMSKKLTPLDRAKSLVRMALPHSQHRPPPPRYYIPPHNLPAGHQHYFVGGGNSSRAPPPPLMKLQSYYQHQQQLNQQSAVQQPYQHSYIQQQLQQSQPRTILPKLPKSLTVVSRTNNNPTAITLRNSGITIEKQSSVPSMRSSHPLPVEKPIISVFREPATSPQQH